VLEGSYVCSVIERVRSGDGVLRGFFCGVFGLGFVGGDEVFGLGFVGGDEVSGWGDGLGELGCGGA
jgi:hypothetical protein